MGCSSYRMTGWDGERGWEHGRHMPLFGVFAGLFILMLLFKTGLWLPLFALGFGFFLFSRMGYGPGRRGFYPGMHHGMGPHRHGWRHGFGPDWNRGEKPKRGEGPFGQRPWYGPTEEEAEKPKRDAHDDEWV